MLALEYAPWSLYHMGSGNTLSSTLSISVIRLVNRYTSYFYNTNRCYHHSYPSSACTTCAQSSVPNAPGTSPSNKLANTTLSLCSPSHGCRPCCAITLSYTNTSPRCHLCSTRISSVIFAKRLIYSSGIGVPSPNNCCVGFGRPLPSFTFCKFL